MMFYDVPQVFDGPTGHPGPPRNDGNQANASQNDVKRVVSRRGNESKDSFTGLSDVCVGIQWVEISSWLKWMIVIVTI